MALLPPGRVLDAGCGPGRYLARLEGRSIGADLSAGMAREASSFAPAVVSDVQHLPFASSTFDGALAAHMLYHVPDIGAAAAELARVCRPGATVLAVTNGRGHLAELRAAINREPADGRFTLENGAGQLESHLHVLDIKRFRNRLRVPAAEPVIAYVESTRPFYEPHLPAAATWDAFLDRIRRKVESEIARDGFWSATTEAGIFVCRVPERRPAGGA